MKGETCFCCYTGDEWKAVLQTSSRQCWGTAPNCVYPCCWWGLPEIWEHLQASSGSFHKFEREVHISLFMYLYEILGYILMQGHWAVELFQGEDPWGLEKLAWEEYSSYCCNWWWTNFGTWGSWMSGIWLWIFPQGNQWKTVTQVMKKYIDILWQKMIYSLHNHVECGLGDGNSCW